MRSMYDPKKAREKTLPDQRAIRQDASRYLKAQAFLKTLYRMRGIVSRQEMKTLRGQAIAGDLDGAEKGLYTILGRYGYERKDIDQP